MSDANNLSGSPLTWRGLMTDVARGEFLRVVTSCAGLETILGAVGLRESGRAINESDCEENMWMT